jgi:hypothetical protein
MTNIYIGLDPGNSGAVAGLICSGEATKLLGIFTVPVYTYELTTKTKKGNFKRREHIDLKTLALRLTEILPPSGRRGSMVYPLCELVHALPDQGISSMFNFGNALGYLRGLFDSLSIYNTVPGMFFHPVKLVEPVVWKRAMFPPRTNWSDKKLAITLATELLTTMGENAQRLRPSVRSRVANDGMAEALLMAKYAQIIQPTVGVWGDDRGT